MITDWKHTDLREPSYFDFLMRNRSRRPVVPFELVAGTRRGRVRDVRSARISGLPKHVAEDTGM
jgi:hypothetical protein